MGNLNGNLIAELLQQGRFVYLLMFKINQLNTNKKVLELFAGSKSIGKVAKMLGMDVFSIDKYVEDGMDLVFGVEDLTRAMIVELFGVPDIIWASPVCSAWSKTGWFHYWKTDIYKDHKKFVAKKDFASESVEMIRKTIQVFNWFPDAVFFMENPEGMLMKHPVINDFQKLKCVGDMKRHKVTYCQYGSLIRKPTHIWTNSKKWAPRPHCIEGDKCHLSSPRGSNKGLGAIKGNYNRSKIPEQLCFEVLKAHLPEYNTHTSSISLTNSPTQTTLY